MRCTIVDRGQWSGPAIFRASNFLLCGVIVNGRLSNLVSTIADSNQPISGENYGAGFRIMAVDSKQPISGENYGSENQTKQGGQISDDSK